MEQKTEYQLTTEDLAKEGFSRLRTLTNRLRYEQKISDEQAKKLAKSMIKASKKINE